MYPYQSDESRKVLLIELMVELNMYNADDICKMMDFFIDNIFVQF